MPLAAMPLAAMPLAIILFMSGVVTLLVGAVRSVAAIRVAAGDPDRRRALGALAWSAMSVYGLVLASAGLLLAR